VQREKLAEGRKQSNDKLAEGRKQSNMESDSKRSGMCSGNAGIANTIEEGDILDNKLPKSIIIHILSFLPTKDAVRTSILSKRWEHRWSSSGYFIMTRRIIHLY